MEEVKNPNKEEVEAALPSDIAQQPKRGIGRPLGSVSEKSQPGMTGKRGRPRKQKEAPSLIKLPGRKRGRPRKDSASETLPGTIQKQGRPVKMSKEVGTVRKRPLKVSKGRGRPRKTPLTPKEEEERRKISKPQGPRVWKPLGRPRIYPRVEAPILATSQEPKGRGRPRKSKSKKGAHLHISEPLPTVSSTQTPPADSLPRKRGRPPGSPKANAHQKELPSVPTPDSEAKQDKAKPPPIKRSRRSSGKAEVTEEPPPSFSRNKRDKSKSGRGVNKDDAGESQPAVGQRKGQRSVRAQARVSSAKKTTHERKQEEEEEESIHNVVNQRTSGHPQTIVNAGQGGAGYQEGEQQQKNGCAKKSISGKRKRV